MARETALAQFNKINKTFIMVLQKPEDMSWLNQDLFLYREVEIDYETETIVGNYDSYTVVSMDDQPTKMTEDVLNLLARDKIVDRYPLESQLSILGKTLEQIADANSIACDDLKEMNAYIEEIKRANQIRKDWFAANPDYEYLTTEQLDALMEEKYDGGISDGGLVND